MYVKNGAWKTKVSVLCSLSPQPNTMNILFNSRTFSFSVSFLFQWKENGLVFHWTLAVKKLNTTGYCSRLMGPCCWKLFSSDSLPACAAKVSQVTKSFSGASQVHVHHQLVKHTPRMLSVEHLEYTKHADKLCILSVETAETASVSESVTSRSLISLLTWLCLLVTTLYCTNTVLNPQLKVTM